MVLYSKFTGKLWQFSFFKLYVHISFLDKTAELKQLTDDPVLAPNTAEYREIEKLIDLRSRYYRVALLGVLTRLILLVNLAFMGIDMTVSLSDYRWYSHQHELLFIKDYWNFRSLDSLRDNLWVSLSHHEWSKQISLIKSKWMPIDWFTLAISLASSWACGRVSTVFWILWVYHDDVWSTGGNLGSSDWRFCHLDHLILIVPLGDNDDLRLRSIRAPREVPSLCTF